MSELTTNVPTQLAHRCNDGIDVTLTWVRRGDAHSVRVCVSDRRDGDYFEIEPESYLALDVFYHPFFYRDFSLLDCEDGVLAA